MQKIKKISYYQIFVLIITVLSFVFILKITKRETNDQFKLIRVQVVSKTWSEDMTGGYATKPPIWVLNSVKKGDRELGNNGKEIAEVVKVDGYPNFESFAGQIRALSMDVNNSLNMYLLIKVKTYTDNHGSVYLYDNSLLQNGNSVNLSFPKAKIVGQIVDTDVPDSGYSSSTFTVTGRLRGVDPWLIAKLHKGEKIYGVSPDAGTAEIVDFRVEPFSVVSGQWISYISKDGTNSLKDVVVTLKLTAEKIGDGWYFANNQPIKVGYSLYFPFKDFDLYPVEIENFDIVGNK